MLKLVSKFQKKYALVKNPLTYNQDGLATQHYCDFIQDPLFEQSYALGKNTGSWGKKDVHWRAYIICWAANQVKHLEGDFVECGVNKGGFARTIVNYVNLPSLNKTFYLLDTFAGLVDKYREASKKQYADCYEAVKETFKHFPTVKIIKGTVPDTLPYITSDKICFASIDMNCTTPEIEATKYLWPKLVTGGIIVLDDYGWRGHEAQKHAFNALAKEYSFNILQLPTGQGLIIKI